MYSVSKIPSYPLDQFIEPILYYENYNPPYAKEKILPDGGIDLIIDLMEEPKQIFDNDDYLKIRNVKKGWISGIRKEFITIGATHQSMMVIRFKPGRAYPFFRFPVYELTNSVIELDEIWNSRFLSIRDELMNQPSPEHKIAVIEKFLFNIARNYLEINKSVEFGISKIHSIPAVAKINEITNQSGYSHKHFISLFEKFVGVSPKYYLRVVKFQKAIQSIENKKSICWTEIANDCGYYDQAHFINEFKKFSALNPTEYLSEKGEILNYIPVR